MYGHHNACNNNQYSIFTSLAFSTVRFIGDTRTTVEPRYFDFFRFIGIGIGIGIGIATVVATGWFKVHPGKQVQSRTFTPFFRDRS